MLYDTHCHPNLSKIKETHTIIQAFKDKNPEGFLNIIGTNLSSCKDIILLIKEYDFAYGSVGIHPVDCVEYKNNQSAAIDVLENLYQENREKIKAIGECGLDYHWTNQLAKEHSIEVGKIIQIQKEFFVAQIALAKKYRLPIIIHNRNSREDILEILEKENFKNFIFHCFSEDLAYAKKLISFSPDCKISFSGIVTFKNAKDIQEAAANIPLKNIMVETDTPYLTPTPYRGKEENEPSYTEYVLQKIIELREEDPKEIRKKIFENSKNMFKI